MSTFVNVRALVLFGAVMAGCKGPAGGPAPDQSGSGVATASTATEAPVPSRDAEPLHDAVKQVNDVIVYDIFSPVQASRVYAYASVAAYEVLRQADTSYHSLAGQLNQFAPVPAPPTGVAISLPLAGVHAYMAVGRALTFSQARMDTLRKAMDQRLRTGLSVDVYNQSIAYGDSVAKFVLAWAGKDGFRESRGMPKYSVLRTPGRWIPTPPAYMDAIEPNWATLRPFVMDTSNQFKPAPPLAWDTTRSSPFMREAREVHDVGVNLTAEQREIASFWDCNPFTMHVQGHTMFATKKMSPGGHWMGIVRLASHKADADIVRSSEAYARTAITLADAFISIWAAKYETNVIRPETVIQTYIDEKWEPLLQTPPFPEYTSGHSGISTAASVVLTDFFGDKFAFADSTEVEYGLPVRTFPSFTEAAKEAAISRLYGGIHYRRAVEEGVFQGRKIGRFVLSKVVTRGTRPSVAAAR